MMAWGDFNLSKGFNNIHYMMKGGDPDTTHDYLQSDINIILFHIWIDTAQFSCQFKNIIIGKHPNTLN